MFDDFSTDSDSKYKYTATNRVTNRCCMCTGKKRSAVNRNVLSVYNNIHGFGIHLWGVRQDELSVLIPVTRVGVMDANAYAE